jgi:hypothetical protein
VLYFNQNFQKNSNKVFKDLILIRFKGIKFNYLYVYKKNFISKISHTWIGFTFHSDMKACDIKRQMTTQKNKMT